MEKYELLSRLQVDLNECRSALAAGHPDDVDERLVKMAGDITDNLPSPEPETPEAPETPSATPDTP